MVKEDKELSELLEKNFTIEELRKIYPNFNKKGKYNITKIIKKLKEKEVTRNSSQD